MQLFRGYYQSDTVDVEASNREEARDKAFAKFREIQPHNKRLRPFLVAILPVDAHGEIEGGAPQ
jgi:hypothetical protein